MLKTIILDLGNVIVPFSFDRVHRQIQSRTGLDPEQIRSRLVADGFVRAYESGRIETEAFYEEVSRRLGLAMKFAEFRELWVSIFSPEILIPEPLMRALAGRYRMLLLSNTNRLHYEWLEENYPVLGHFDDRVLSYRAGALKPEPAIYHEALAKAACEPHECFFTDDVPEYVAGARAAGIDAVVFTGCEALRGHLAARGVVL